MKNGVFQFADLVSVADEFKLTEIKYEEKNIKIKIKKSHQAPKVEVQAVQASKVVAPAVPTDNYEEVLSAEIGKYKFITSNGEKLISIGDKIKVGQTIGTISVIGTKTPIKSTVEGEIVEILVENGGIVDYGKPLLKVKVNK